MILVRDVFQLKFGKAREARELWKEAQVIMKKVGTGPSRAMSDLTGPFYTFVLEGSYESLAAYEQAVQTVQGSEEWQRWYEKFTPLVDSGQRETYTLLD